MSRSIFLGLIACSLLIAGVGFINGPLIGLMIPLVVYLLAGLWNSPAAPALDIQRTISDERATPGSVITISLRIHNPGPALDEILVEDLDLLNAEITEGSPRQLLALPAGATTTMSYSFRARRGYYPLQHVRVTRRDHFALNTRVTDVSVDGHIFVLPLPARVRRLAIRPRRTRVYSGSIPAREGGPGVEFFGVREYAAGDSLRWVNWRISARHTNSLFTNEFEQERVADVGLILDARLRTNLFGGANIFDHAALAAASLADAFIGAGNHVGLLIYGRGASWTAPGYGKLQREYILHGIARAEVGETQAFAELIIPRRLFPPYSQMVLISTLHNDDAEVLIRMRAFGYQVIVVSPDPVSFEQRHLPNIEATQLAARIVRLERRILLSNLRRAGIQVIDWDVHIPFEQAVGATLSRPPAYLRALDLGGGA